MSQKNISVLFLTKYARNGASSRYRSFQYLPYLKENKINYHVSPLFNENYLKNYYKFGRSFLRDIISAFIRRLGILTKAKRFDSIVIEYELLPYFPAFLERYLTVLNIPYIVDYDDALFHQYDQHSKKWVRQLLGHKISKVMQCSHTVIAGNDYLAHYAKKAGSANVEIIPTVIDLTRYTRHHNIKKKPIFTIVWIGSSSTTRYLLDIAPALAELCNTGANIRLIGAKHIELAGIPEENIEFLPWSEDSEVSLISECHVGIMPLPDTAWERGKCGFKLIQYMGCRLPVIASPVGVNTKIVEQGKNGYLASSMDDWVNALIAIRDNPQASIQMGISGFKKVEANYSLQVWGPRYAQLITKICDQHSTI